tara:strand:- start:578 stop:706 length:129 start_codon:yes stop_codon:yes gene_type:complete
MSSKLSDLAGKLEVTEEEAEETKYSLRKGWKKWSDRLLRMKF